MPKRATEAPRKSTAAGRGAKSSKPKAAKRAPEAKTAAASPEPPGHDGYHIADPAEFASNMMRVGAQSQKLIGDFLKRQRNRGGDQTFDPLNLAGAFSELVKGLSANPAAVVEAQMQLWHDYMQLWERTARQAMGGTVEPMVTPATGDKRFRDKDWEENQVFDFIKQSYLLTANWLQQTVGNIEGLDTKSRKRVQFYTKQFADAIAPTNFILTNPAVLRTTLQTNGENLIKGLENLLEDLDRGGGELAIRQSADAFEVGENIATAPGKVVFRNDLIELLQYEPTTEQVYERPLLIFPPWINKFYILDLKPENSFIRWAVAQGYTVFVVSWVNPDKRLAKKGFEDYMREGIFAALDAVKRRRAPKASMRSAIASAARCCRRHWPIWRRRATPASTRPPSSPRRPISPNRAICRSSSTMPSSKRWSSR